MNVCMYHRSETLQYVNKLLLLNTIHPNTFNHISVSAGETPIIRTEPRISAVRFSPEETPGHHPNRTAQLHGYILARGKHPPSELNYVHYKSRLSS